MKQNTILGALMAFLAIVGIAAVTTGPNNTGTNVINSTTVTGGNYKVYRALVSQSGDGNNPTSAVVENSLGGTPAWQYGSAGTYQLILSGAFPANKVFARIGGKMFHVESIPYIARTDNDTLTVVTWYQGEPLDGQLSSTPVEILVYP